MFLRYIHNFRGIAILFVVSGHCIRFFSWDQNPNTERLLNAILLNGATMFVFIAGFLFQHLRYKYSYSQYLKNKAKNIIFPYLIISIPAIIYLVFIEKMGHWTNPSITEQPVYYQILWFYLTGKHLVPLWFIPMISIFYLLFPVFVFIDQHPNTYRSFLPFFLCITLLIHRPLAESNIIHVSILFFSVYLMGMCYSRYREIAFIFLQKYGKICLTLPLLLLFIELRFYNRTGIIYVDKIFSHNKELIDINMIQIICVSILGIYYLKKYDHILQGTRVDNFLSIISAMSFGIYFVHYYFIDALIRTKYMFKYEISGNLLFVIALATGILALSFLSLKLAKLVFQSNSRYITGW